MLEAKLSPSMMCVDAWAGASETLHAMEVNHIDYLHVDIMDGHFVPNFTLGTDFVKSLRKQSQIPLDIHLMVQAPEEKLGWFAIQPGEYVSVHAESTIHLQRVLAQIRSLGAKLMAALNPATPLCVLEDILEDIDGVLLMTVNPGFAGQKLVPQTLEKISRLRCWLDDRGYTGVEIEVDGNVSFENAVKMRAAGANIFVAGSSSVFRKNGEVAVNILKLRRMIEEEG